MSCDCQCSVALSHDAVGLSRCRATNVQTRKSLRCSHTHTLSLDVDDKTDQTFRPEKSKTQYTMGATANNVNELITTKHILSLAT